MRSLTKFRKSFKLSILERLGDERSRYLFTNHKVYIREPLYEDSPKNYFTVIIEGRLGISPPKNTTYNVEAIFGDIECQLGEVFEGFYAESPFIYIDGDNFSIHITGFGIFKE